MIAPHDSEAELEQLKAVIERLPDGIVTVNRDLVVVSANRSAKRLFPPTSLAVGEPLPDVWPDFAIRAFATDLFANSTGPVTENVSATPDRTYAIVGIPARRASTAVLMIEDASARERRAAVQREFVANAAHELLTPLTGIVGAAHALESGAKFVPETRDRFLGHIARECDRLARIARALLVLARARSGEEPPKLELVELGPLLEAAVEDAGEGEGIKLHCPAALKVFVDRDLVEQALTNLVANARRHAPESPVTISVQEKGNHVVGIEISDGGAGMSPEQLDRMQRRFASGGGRAGGGFGLGLSIAMQALETSGGTLTVESTPGEGTVARVELPTGRVNVA